MTPDPRPATRDPRLKIVFAGTPEFAAVALRALLESPHTVAAVYTQPDRPAGRGRKTRPSPVKQLAQEAGCTLRQPDSLKASETQDELRAWQADVMVVAAYGLLLPPAVLAMPPLGCLNIHASLLPRWRGAAPIQRAILAGDSETGISIMQMEAGLDTGPVLHRVPTPIGPTDTAASLHDRLAGIGARALLATLEALSRGAVEAVPQDEGLATYASKLDKTEAELDWSRPATELARRVRAFNPWPIAQTRLAGAALRVWEAQALTSAADAAPTIVPGIVLAAGPEGIEVATGSGVLRLLRLQLPGGKPMSSADLLRGRAELFRPGTHLGADQ